MRRESYISGVDGARIHYVVNFGKGVRRGVPLVFLHGAGGNTTVWTPFLRHFSDRSWIAVDLRGHGRSDLRSRWSLAASVADVASVLRREGFAGVVVIGNCLGATVAVELRRACPELVRGLILSSVFGRRYVRFGGILHFLSWVWCRFVSFLPHRRSLSYLDRQPHRFFPVWLMPYHDLRSTSHRTYFKSIVDLFEYPLDLGVIDVPVLVLQGRFDPFCRLGSVIRDADRNPLVSLHILPANHLVSFQFHDVALPHVARFVGDA